MWWVVLDNAIKTNYQSLRLAESDNLKINLLVSPHTRAPGGHAHRNFVLDLLEGDDEQWIYNLDDDNILHPGFINFFLTDNELDNYDVALFAQILADGTLRLNANTDSIKVNHVDTAMCLFRKKALRDGLRYVESYCGDGYFLEALFNNNSNKFFIRNTPLCYYNYLHDKPYKFLNTLLNTCPVQILQEEWEFATLVKLYRQLNPEHILEIGSFFGGTLWFWLNNAARLDQVVSIDCPIPPQDERYAKMIASKALWKNWIKSTITFTEITGDSTQDATVQKVAAVFPAANVDFLFIDGGHDYNTVKSDYENYSKFVRPEGMIVFHDVIGLEEVSKYWNEVKKGKKYLEIYNASGGWGIGIIYK